MKECKLKLGNKTNGIELSYFCGFETLLGVGIYTNKECDDFELSSKDDIDVQFFKSFKTLTPTSPIIKWEWTEKYFTCSYEIKIDIQKKNIYMLSVRYDGDNETLYDLSYNLNDKDIKKLLKFVKQMNEVDNENSSKG